MTSCTVGIFCCGCTLQQGSLIIGWLMLICNFAEAIVTAVLYFSMDVHIGLTDFEIWLSVAISMLGASLSLLLIVGANKRNPKYLMIWVYITTTLALLGILLTIALSVMSGIYLITVIYIIILPLIVYIIVVVRSYGLQLYEECNPVTEQAHTNSQDNCVNHIVDAEVCPDYAAFEPPPTYPGLFNIGYGNVENKGYSPSC